MSVKSYDLHLRLKSACKKKLVLQRYRHPDRSGGNFGLRIAEPHQLLCMWENLFWEGYENICFVHIKYESLTGCHFSCAKDTYRHLDFGPLWPTKKNVGKKTRVFGKQTFAAHTLLRQIRVVAIPTVLVDAGRNDWFNDSAFLNERSQASEAHCTAHRAAISLPFALSSIALPCMHWCPSHCPSHCHTLLRLCQCIACAPDLPCFAHGSHSYSYSYLKL